MRRVVGVVALLVLAVVAVFALTTRAPVGGANLDSQPIELVANPESIEEPELIVRPFPPRQIRLPEPGEPVPSETAAYCDDSNWRNTDVIVERPAAGVFAVDEANWNATGAGTRAGLASWMSQCHRHGGPIEIVAASTGEVLAIYDVWSGLRSPFE